MSRSSADVTTNSIVEERVNPAEIATILKEVLPQLDREIQAESSQLRLKNKLGEDDLLDLSMWKTKFDKSSQEMNTFFGKEEFHDAALAECLLKAQKDDANKLVATVLLDAQVQWWIDKKKTPENVFEILELDQAKDKLLAVPAITRKMGKSDAAPQHDIVKAKKEELASSVLWQWVHFVMKLNLPMPHQVMFNILYNNYKLQSNSKVVLHCGLLRALLQTEKDTKIRLGIMS